MKKLKLFLGLSLFCSAVHGQTVLPGTTGPVKLTDVVAAYKATHPGYGEKPNRIVKALLPELPKEADEPDYQFERWLWYWRQHLDGNGNIVSPVKTWQEWEKTNQYSTARTTSGAAILGDWSFQGPDSSGADGNGVGRISNIAFHPTNASTFWIGSPGGGAWKTTNNGVTWTCMTDQLPLLSVTQVVFNPLNPNTIYLCTGDRDGSDYYSIGILKSTNGGTTWNTTGLTYTTSSYNFTNALLINPTDTNSLLVATSTGIEQSSNGGASWTSVGPSGNFYQLVYCPGSTSIIYATSYYNYASSTSAQIYRSANGGATWTQVTSLTNTDRVSIAVTPANPAIVKAVASYYSTSGSTANEGLSGIFSSSDTGHTFTEIFTPGDCNTGNQNLLSFNSDGTGCGGQGFYDLPIAISPTNANIMYVGGVNGWSSADGGTSWTIMNQWSNYYGPGSGTVADVITIHADKHFMGFNPLSPGTFYETNDGGIYSTTTPTATGVWNNLTNGLGITEVYRTAVSNTGHYELLGAQDVGSKFIKPGLYQEADGGDGMVCQIDPVDTTVGYTASENGYIDILSPITALSPSDISGNILGGSIEGTGGWLTPYVLEPSCHMCILAGYGSVYRSTDEGTTWSTISPALITSSGYGDLLRIATTDADANTIYVAEDGTENIFYTHDLGTTWTTITGTFGSFPNSDVKVDPRDKNHIWVTYGGYGSPQVAQWNLSTGAFTQMNTGLPDVPVNCIAIDTQNRDLYVGTDLGVYFMDTTMTSWVPYTLHMPAVRVNDLQIDYGTNEIWAATFGRSLWKSNKHMTTSVENVSTIPFTNDALTIAPNPNRGTFTVTVKNVTDRQVSLSLMDNSGKIVWKDNGTLTGNQITVNVKGVASATYILEVATENGIAGRQKVVIY